MYVGPNICAAQAHKIVCNTFRSVLRVFVCGEHSDLYDMFLCMVTISRILFLLRALLNSVGFSFLLAWLGLASYSYVHTKYTNQKDALIFKSQDLSTICSFFVFIIVYILSFLCDNKNSM